MKYIFLFFSFSIISGVTIAQPDFDFEKLKAEFKNEHVLYLNQTEHLEIRKSKEGLEMVSKINNAILYLDDYAGNYAEKRIPYSEHFERIDELEAITYIPDGKRYKKARVEDIIDRRVSKDGVFYDDAHEKYFIYKGLQPGAVTEVTYEQVYKDPFFIGSFWFEDYMPVQYARYNITAPSSVKIKYKLFGDTSLVLFTKKISGDKITYSWEAKNLKAKEYEPEASAVYKRPTHIIPYISSYEVDKEVVQVLGEPKQLYKWYYPFVENLNVKPSRELKDLVDSLITGVSQPEEKIKRIYYWVQESVKYIAFEDGLGGYQPRDAEVVLQRRFGDCKDMSSILTAMLRIAGLDAYLCIIGTRHIPYKYSDFALPQLNNHMICALNDNGKWKFLDATFNALKYGLNPYHIQNREALIIKDSNTFEVYAINETDKSVNLIIDTVMLTINNNTLDGSGEIRFTGYHKSNYQMECRYLASKDIYERFSKVVQAGNNKCITDTLNYRGLTDRDQDLIIDYKYHIHNYSTVVDNSVFVNLNLDKPYKDTHINKAQKKYDIEHDFKSQDIFVAELEVPAGYTVVKIPTDVKFENPKFGFTIKYEQKGNRIRLHRTCFVDTLSIKPESFDTWNEMILKLNNAYKQTIELVKK
ncbi:MAG: DUF3857 domain-containing protein [Bacteroidetes bacterium]|nr:DUF3857 domain-containing protein [Bacteroidota bacterium]